MAFTEHDCTKASSRLTDTHNQEREGAKKNLTI
jgi:hypothetical protein